MANLIQPMKSGESPDKEIVELVFACAVFNFGNKFNITMRLDTTEESDYPKGMAYPFEGGGYQKA
jgi:hypothetical protein